MNTMDQLRRQIRRLFSFERFSGLSGLSGLSGFSGLSGLSLISIAVFCCLSLHAQLPPRADDPFWRDSIPAEMRQSYIRYGEQYLGKPWAALPFSAFAQFRGNGNRVGYEGLNFGKRRQLAALVMAEIVEGQGRFMTDIIDGLGSFCEETWWGIPAHYGPNIPLTEDQTVDLFNAETASLIAWTRYMLQSQLDQFSPRLCQRLDREIERRILKPAVEKDYWWKKAGMNWNPWICSNWLTCVLICEKDEARRAEAIGQIVKATQAFIDAYPDDGGCDEGAGYWDRAAASMFEVLRLMSNEQLVMSNYDYLTSAETSTDSASKSNHNYSLLITNYSLKIKRMASYAYKTYIGSDYCITFADAHDNRAIQQVNIVYPFGLFIGDKTMQQFGAYLGRQRHVLEAPAELYDRSGNFPTLGRELMFLRHIREFMAEEPREPLLKDVWLADLQIMTARRGPYYVAMKGGHNDESHNHNDVGSFIVYTSPDPSKGVTPLFIDAGVGEYTSKTFSRERYTIWTMQSAYHNLPQINGCDQKEGKQYAAKVVSHKPGQLTLDIAGAYPEQATVKRWRRTVKVATSGITVTEDYELGEYRQPTRLMLMTVAPDALSRISYDRSQLSATVEDISSTLDPLLQGLWGQRMYRVVLTVKSRQTKGTIRYSIR